jgi:hypothetical protein
MSVSQQQTPPAASIWSPDEPRARRSLMLCALGAVLGLVIAGIGLFTAKGTRTSAVPAEDVALVNQVPILLSDYLVQLRALYDVSLSEATPQQKKKVLDDMIHEELYVQRGVELGLQSDTIEVRTALVGAVEAQVAAEATMAQPGEAELRAYYDHHIDRYASEGLLALDDFVIAPGARLPVAEIRAALGENPARNPADLGLIRTGNMKDGEEFYFAAKIHLGAVLFTAATRLKAGELSGPVVAPDGTHVLRVKENVVPVPRSYADARDAVLQDYIAEQTRILTSGNDRFLRRRADISVAKGFE